MQLYLYRKVCTCVCVCAYSRFTAYENCLLLLLLSFFIALPPLTRKSKQNKNKSKIIVRSAERCKELPTNCRIEALIKFWVQTQACVYVCVRVVIIIFISVALWLVWKRLNVLIFPTFMQDTQWLLALESSLREVKGYYCH